MKWAIGSIAVLVAFVMGVAVGWVARARQPAHAAEASVPTPAPTPSPTPVPTVASPTPTASQAPAIADTAPFAWPTGPATADVVAIDPTHYVVREAYARKVLGDTRNLATGARFVPVWGDGGPAAVRVFGVRAGGPEAQLGFENGDTLETLDGISLATPETALEAYSHATKSKKLALAIKRRGVELELHYLVAP